MLNLICTCQRVGVAVEFLISLICAFPRRREHWRALMMQTYIIGNKTLLIVMVAGAFIGMVTTLQGYMSLARFGAESGVGGMVAYSIYRELGPVVTALLFTGRVGSLLASEMAMMQINNQFVCLEMMAVNANRLVLFPRFLAVVVSVPLLTIIFCISSVLASYFICDFALGVPAGTFWNSLLYQNAFVRDVLHGVGKSIIFGAVIAWVALYQGMFSEKSRRGMSIATTSTVVTASLLVLGIDYVSTSLLGGHL